MMRRRLGLVILVWASLFRGVDTQASPQDTQDPLLTLNQDFRRTYSHARAARLAASGPVLLCDGDKLVLLEGKERTEKSVVPPLYHHLKAVAHVPLGLFVLLDECGEGPFTMEQLERFRRWRELIQTAQGTLDQRGFIPDQLERQRAILTECLVLLDDVLKREQYPDKDRTAFARAMAPRVLANASDAARAQIDGYHGQVMAWKKKWTAGEWGRLRVVVIGSALPRKDHIAVQYFSRILGEPGEGRRIIYAESLYEETRAMNLLGSHLLDRTIATAFFGDPQRMHRDLLADAAAKYLAVLKVE
jgi:hypothetical protein